MSGQKQTTVLIKAGHTDDCRVHVGGNCSCGSPPEIGARGVFRNMSDQKQTTEVWGQQICRTCARWFDYIKRDRVPVPLWCSECSGYNKPVVVTDGTRKPGSPSNA